MKDKELNLDEIMQEFGGEEESLNPEEAAVSHSMTDTQDLLDSIAQINGRTQQAEEIADALQEALDEVSAEASDEMQEQTEEPETPAEPAEEAAEETEEPQPEEPVIQDTIRLDDLSEVAGTPPAFETAMTDDTARIQPVWEEEDEDEDSVEINIPAPILFRPKQRLRELKRDLIAGPEKRYYELAEQGVGKLQLGMLVCILVVLVSAGAGFLYSAGLVPENRMRLMVFGQVLAMLIGALMASHQMIDGVSDLFRGRFTLNMVLLITFLASCADAWFCLQELRVPLCAAFTLEAGMALWAVYHRRTTEMGQMDTMRKAVRLDSIVKTEDYLDGKNAYQRSEGRVSDFMDHFDEIPRPERIQHIFAVMGLLVSAAVAALAGLRHGISMAVQIFSTTLLVAVPASFFISITRPMAVLERRMHRLGTVLCGWQGIKGLGGRAVFPLSDSDLFPSGSCKMNGVKFYGTRAPEVVIAYAAALIKVNGGSLAPAFEQLLTSRNGIRYEAKNMQYYGNGGIGGEICDEPVLMGTLDFLKQMGVEIPEGVMVKQAVYVSIDGELSGLFAIAYSKMKYSASGLATLCGNRKLNPVVIAEDFMVTAPFLKEKFGVRTRRIMFPEREVREELAAKKPSAEAVALALTTQEGLAPAAYAITGARALRTSWKLGLFVHILGGILGMLIMAALAYLGSTELLTPLNILMYQLLWMVPGFLVTLWPRTV